MENPSERIRNLERENAELRRRLTLSDNDRSVLAGREDGLIPVGLARSIFRRVFGEDLLASQ